MKTDLITKLNKYVKRGGPQECWNWIGLKNEKGVGILCFEGKNNFAKHIMYKILFPEEIITGHLKNLCKNYSCVNPFHHITREKLMNSLIDKNEKPGCWIWKGTIKGGYGFFGVNGKKKMVHRFMYERYKGVIPLNMNVCHSCDTPSCVNPGHLWLGTQFDNMKDMNLKGRGNYKKGENHASAKITSEQAKKIKLMYRDGFKMKEIERKLNISYKTIHHICAGDTWKHVLIDAK